ncbi:MULTISPECIES: 16S rRNA (uracil(1498)-N(3))-methyltransferase [unclassified Corynebacterium]|uniref:16S rRNA (uracil(1498)-N(3))-methyltransferase n=1 Tax=unclassified Corynebacterium TaxID=2624378 RepID=UPI0029CA3ACF|nr:MULTISPECIES: 16S rRNA (uracil(1498)-N(3))-methyltransferase [unclassified Corynebacterium]WPF65547.1 16S rRNA (uracil(1498)-N(3))-methyltransferase [Corynebacterium sp. 22KM0430]WPF68042.1 16S rRNA (uracil(1498)-N(3))-methyltransferase [Corynebacterium sp. 21KM1197]
MSLPVFLCEALSAETLPGTTLGLDGPEGRHAVTVKRIRVGERVELVDTRGVRAVAVVRAVEGKTSLRAEVESLAVEEPPRPRVTVVQALPKAERSELAIDLATQAGADAFVPWQAERCVARWAGTKEKKGREKWQAAAREAAKQARRARVPEVAAPVDTAGLIDLLRAEPEARALLLHEAAASPLAECDLDAEHLYLIVGPEGGIGEEEAERLRRAGAVPVRLGPEVLRTASAAMVGLAALGVLTSRW